MDKIALRRRNLRTAIDAANKKLGFKSDISFCEHYDLNASHISQLINGHGVLESAQPETLKKKSDGSKDCLMKLQRMLRPTLLKIISLKAMSLYSTLLYRQFLYWIMFRLASFMRLVTTA